MAEPEYRTPGQLIQHLLKERGWPQFVLAAVLGRSQQTVSMLLKGKAPVTAELAVKLEQVFDVKAERFVELEAAFALRQARDFALVAPDGALARRAALFSALPLTEMAKRGWISVEDLRDAEAVESELARFFSVENTSEIPVSAFAAKKTGDDPTMTPIQLAWLYRARQVAGAMLAKPYSQAGLRDALKELRGLLKDVTAVRFVPRVLLDCGVRFVAVEALAGSKIDGVCFWLDEAPVVTLSLRLDRIDNFWFVLRHEIEHALRGDGRSSDVVIDSELERKGPDPAIAEQERIANAAALDFCVPSKEMASFYARKRPFFYDRDIVNFASRIGVHPGLVAGQIRHRLQRWDMFRDLLVPVRSAVLPNARSDGWGHVAPVVAQ